MSDGPWRSLPLQKHWRKVARIGEVPAFSIQELQEAITSALRKDAEEIPLEDLRGALAPRGQEFLIEPDVNHLIARHEARNPGAKLLHLFSRYACYEEGKGEFVRSPSQLALAGALKEHALESARAITEHSLKVSRAEEPVEQRLEDALRQIDFLEFSSQLLEGVGPRASNSNSARRTEIDDGPLL